VDESLGVSSSLCNGQLWKFNYTSPWGAHARIKRSKAARRAPSSLDCRQISVSQAEPANFARVCPQFAQASSKWVTIPVRIFYVLRIYRSVARAESLRSRGNRDAATRRSKLEEYDYRILSAPKKSCLIYFFIRFTYYISSKRNLPWEFRRTMLIDERIWKTSSLILWATTLLSIMNRVIIHQQVIIIFFCLQTSLLRQALLQM